MRLQIQIYHSLLDTHEARTFRNALKNAPKYNLVDEGVFPNKVYLLAVYVNITTHS